MPGRHYERAMSDILEAIASYKRIDVAERKLSQSLSDLEAAAKHISKPRGFLDALERRHTPGRLALIADIKKASPSKGLIRADFDPPSLAKAYVGRCCLPVCSHRHPQLSRRR